MKSNNANLDGARLFKLFPSPIIEYLWPDSQSLNRELTQLILEKEKLSKGIETTNVGGWHSKKDFQDWDGTCVQVMLSRMLAVGREMLKRHLKIDDEDLLTGWTIQSWANINRYGNYNKFHTHVRNLNLWSGVYYVDTGLENGEDVTGARIVFADQYGVEVKGRDELKQRYSIVPTPGLMLLFPSALGHRVEPHAGQGNRITIAFNLRHERFTTIAYEIEKKSKGT